LPENLEPVNILVIGGANEQPASPERHSNERIPLDKLISYEKLP